MRFLALALATLLAVAAARAADAPTVVAESTETVAAPIEEILVTGEQPGPGLWRVTNPADPAGRELLILGTYGPLPKKLEWRSAELEAALARSQEVIGPVSMQAGIGPLGGVTLLPSLIGLRKNPGGQRLQDVVPPELYARWLPLKERYIGRDDDAERWRPIFAAGELFEKALRRSGLEVRGTVWPAVEKLARRARVPVTRPEVKVAVEKPRDVIRGFKEAPLDDVECFARTIARLESDLDLMRVRANAWATGDVAKLRALAPVDNATACIEAVLNSQVLQEQGAAEWPARRAEAWLAAAEQALRRNATTVTVLSIDLILRPDGYVARLRERGYLVEDPSP
jgi:hypothetical protein